MFCTTGERLSLLVLRTTPGLGNVTVDWTLEGPFAQRTFSKPSGTLFFTKVHIKIEITKGFFVASRCFCDSQGQLNGTIDLQLLDDATPEDKAEYTVSLSNIRTFGKACLNSPSLFKISQQSSVVTQRDVPLTPAQV